SREGATVVCLLPARTDTRWWHDIIEPYATQTKFLKGRLRFGDAQNSAPVPSAVAAFSPVVYFTCPQCERQFRPARTDAQCCGGACRQAACRARRVTDKGATAGASQC